MNSLQAETFFLSGDLEGIYRMKPTNMRVSDLFIDCLNYAHHNALDRIVERCLFLSREHDYLVLETDVDFRNRAIYHAPALDAYCRTMWGIPIDGDEELLDRLDKAIGASSPYHGKLNKTCAHEWKIYHGLFEQDEYCTKCNEKRK